MLVVGKSRKIISKFIEYTKNKAYGEYEINCGRCWRYIRTFSKDLSIARTVKSDFSVMGAMRGNVLNSIENGRDERNGGRMKSWGH